MIVNRTIGAVFPSILLMTSLVVFIQLFEFAPDIKERQIDSNFTRLSGQGIEREREMWNRFLSSKKAEDYRTSPSEFIKESIEFIDPDGKALIYPLDNGHNAVYLAQNGLNVEGVDFSDVAIRKTHRLASRANVHLTSLNKDLNKYQFGKKKYDVIIATDLHRTRLVQEIKKGLKAGGFVIYESFTTDQLKLKDSPIRVNKSYLLKPNELKEMFSDYEILKYHEYTDGLKAKVTLLARKPII